MAPNGRKPSTISETGSRLSRVVSQARFRWLIFFLCHLANFFASAISSALTITIVAMIHDEKTLASTTTNATLSVSQSHHVHVNWNGVQKDRMLQALSWGTLATSIIGGRLSEIFGPRHVISVTLLTAGLLNLIFPVVSVNSFWAAYAIRIVQGLAIGVIHPTMGVVVSRWSPKYEIALSNMIASSGFIMANIIVHPIAGLLVSGDFLGGWPSVFYIFGTLTLVIVIPWYFLVYDDPESHPRLSAGELEEIVRSRSLKTGVSKTVPWVKMLTSVPVLAYLTVAFTYRWVLALVSSQIPSFYEEVLDMSFEKNGFMTSLPWLLAIFIGSLTSASADRIRRTERFSITSIRKAFTLLALGGVSIGMFLVTLVGKNSTAAVALVTVAKGIGTASNAGSAVNYLDICPSFAGTLYGMRGVMASLSELAMNEGVARIVGNEPTQEKWYKFFYLTSALNAVGLIVFCLFASGEVQKWDPSWQPEKPVEKKKDENANHSSSP